MTFAAAVSMKEVVTRTLHVCLRNGSMDWGARKSLSEQMESPASVNLSVVFRAPCGRNDHCGRDQSSR